MLPALVALLLPVPLHRRLARRQNDRSSVGAKWRHQLASVSTSRRDEGLASRPRPTSDRGGNCRSYNRASKSPDQRAAVERKPLDDGRDFVTDKLG